MVHYTLILEGKYRLSIGRLSFPHTCDRAQQKQKSDILVYSNIFKLEINLDHMYHYSMGSIDFGDHNTGIAVFTVLYQRTYIIKDVYTSLTVYSSIL
jgi:hypothetical protein